MANIGSFTETNPRTHYHANALSIAGIDPDAQAGIDPVECSRFCGHAV